MFGISWAEFLVIVLVGVLVIPARMWPDVARFVARLINMVRRTIWYLTDTTENIKQQIDLEKPIDNLIQSTTSDMLDTFSTVVSGAKKKTTRQVKNKKVSK